MEVKNKRENNQKRITKAVDLSSATVTAHANLHVSLFYRRKQHVAVISAFSPLTEPIFTHPTTTKEHIFNSLHVTKKKMNL